jgi:hypothetical protein
MNGNNRLIAAHGGVLASISMLLRFCEGLLRA